MGIDTEVRARLQRWVRGPTTPQRVVRRARIILHAMDGVSLNEIAHRVGVSRPTVTLWIERFRRDGIDALWHDAPGRGRRPSVNPSTLRDRLERQPLLDADGKPITLRRAAAILNVSTTTLWRALRQPSSRRRTRR
jgi:transposase